MTSHREIDNKVVVSEQRIGTYSLLFASPEAVLGVKKWREKIFEPLLHRHVAVDEAHCVSKWCLHVICECVCAVCVCVCLIW